MARTPQPGLVSVVIPTYQRHRELREAIGSVIQQTMSEWEILVIPDGPDAVVGSIIESYSDPRIRYLDTPWIGLAGNHQRNVGAVFSNGEFLLFLDDDNLLYPQALETFRTGFSNPLIGYVICPIDYEGRGVLSPDQELSIKNVDTLNFMIRRSALGKAGLWSWFYHADHDLIKRVSRVAKGVHLDVPPIGIHR